MSALFRRCNPPCEGAGPVARRGGAEIFLPAAAGPVLVTSGALANTFGAWTAIGTPANDFYISHPYAVHQAIHNAIINMLVEFGHGAGPAALDATRDVSPIVDPAADDAGYQSLTFTSWPMLVPAGSQVQARAWAGAALRNFHVMVAGWDSAYPTWDALPADVAVGPGRYYPANSSAAGIAIAAAAWGAWGAWSQVVAAAPNDMLAVQVVPLATVGNVGTAAMAYQLGIGAAGAEVACATVLTGRAYRSPWIDPPVWVKSGERLAIRAQGSAAGAKPALVKVHDF